MVFRNSTILAALAIISTVLAVVRDRLLSEHVGVGPILDVFNAAFRIPDLLYAILFATVTSGTVVPYLTKLGQKGDSIDKDTFSKLWSISVFFSTVVLILGAVLYVCVPGLASYIAPGFTETQKELFVAATRLALIQPLFLGLASLISCLAQLRNQFVLYGISPLVYSFGIIGGILYLYEPYGVYGLMYGVVIGAFGSFLLQLFSLRGVKMSLKSENIRKDIMGLLTLSFPRTGTNILTQVRHVMLTSYATLLGPGVLTSFVFAEKIFGSCAVIVQQSLTTASMPVLAREFAENRARDFYLLVRKALVYLFFLGFILASSLYAFRDIVISILYGSTPYAPTISMFLTVFLFILPLQMVAGYLSVSLYAMRDTANVFVAYLVATVITAAVLFFGASLGSEALLIAIAVFTFAIFLLQSLAFLRKVRLHGGFKKA